MQYVFRGTPRNGNSFPSFNTNQKGLANGEKEQKLILCCVWPAQGSLWQCVLHVHFWNLQKAIVSRKATSILMGNPVTSWIISLPTRFFRPTKHVLPCQGPKGHPVSHGSEPRPPAARWLPAPTYGSSGHRRGTAPGTLRGLQRTPPRPGVQRGSRTAWAEWVKLGSTYTVLGKFLFYSFLARGLQQNHSPRVVEAVGRGNFQSENHTGRSGEIFWALFQVGPGKPKSFLGRPKSKTHAEMGMNLRHGGFPLRFACQEATFKKHILKLKC